MSLPPSEPAMLPLELTLVLAATRDMGIGLRGTLPWTGLKKEMAYFARVTKRLPPSVCLFRELSRARVPSYLSSSESHLHGPRLNLPS